MTSVLFGGAAMVLCIGFLTFYGLSGFPNTLRWNLIALTVSLVISGLFMLSFQIAEEDSVDVVQWIRDTLFGFPIILLFNRFTFPFGTRRTFAKWRESRSRKDQLEEK